MSERIEKQGQYWVYGFEGIAGGTVVYFYAFREADARQQYEEAFGHLVDVEKKALLSREPW